jgi:hypothetical protein
MVCAGHETLGLYLPRPKYGRPVFISDCDIAVIQQVTAFYAKADGSQHIVSHVHFER